MTPHEIFFLTLAILGGLALFILGMNIMTDGLRHAAGGGLRSMLARATRHRFAGIAMGTFLGSLVQSSATTVMLVGFINAGLMTLAESVPPMLGANIGTTVSMQLISFKLGDYCYLAITLGFIMQFASPHPKAKHIGEAILGFGLIFLGMNTMSGAIAPHRELFGELLRGVHGETLAGVWKGLLLSAAVTGVIQSSGAVIGMCFALITAGVFTELSQVYPIVLGAHIGTCATALLGSIGTNIEARRSAVSHLLFNIITSTLAAFLAPLFYRLIPYTANDLVRQTANVHTAVMLMGAALVLPISPLYARLVRRVVPSRRAPPQPSFLDNQLVEYPEKAICAAISEIQRVTRICARSFRLNMDVLLNVDRKKVQAIKLNENVVDEIKLAMKEYLATMTRRHLSRRQAIIIQHLNRCMADVERIGDHIDEICDISVRRSKVPLARFDRTALELIFGLYESADKVLHLVIESLDPENPDFQGQAQAILLARDEYVEKSINAKAQFTERIANHELPPINGMFFSEYIAAFDRIVKHAKTIALAEKQPYFWIKRKKLERVEEEAPEYKPPPLSDPHDFLDRLHSEEYL
jgi:phosphate:Na+ symporter